MIYSIRNASLITIFALTLMACSGGEQGDATDASINAEASLDALYHEFDEEFLELNPIFATFRGDNRYKPLVPT